MSDSRTATLYRMVLPDHAFPFGERARAMLEQHGFEIDEHILRSRAEVEDAKARFGVATTPVILIAGEQIDGSDALERYLADA